MAQVATIRPPTIRPNSMPSLPEFMPPSADLEFDFDPNNIDQKSGLVEWVDGGSHCTLNPSHRFRAYRRRHHCRACGLLVCSSCSRSSRPLPGFGLSDDRPHRLCDACAIRSNEDLETLSSLWQAVANKNTSAAELADTMNSVYNIGFLFAHSDAPNWIKIRQYLLTLLQLEMGIVQNLLEELLGSADLTVTQIDELALRRAHRFMKTLEEAGRHVPFLLSETFRNAFNRVLELREHSARREAIAFHHNRMMHLVKTPFAEVTMDDVVKVWGGYQAWAEDNRLAVSTALEARVRELLNQVVRRDQSFANAELELALNSKSFVQIRKAMITCDAVMGVLVQSPYRDHVMPDIHVVIPGFAAHRRSATKLLADADSRKKLVRREMRKKSLYPPRRI